MNQNNNLIGIINFEDLIQEEEIGRTKFKKIGTCKIEVYSNEGDIPHFHVFEIGGDFHSCPKIFEPGYFPHDGKEDKFNNNQLEQLDKWLSEPYKDNNKFTNWEYIAYKWKMDGNRYNVTMNSGKPDYKKSK